MQAVTPEALQAYLRTVFGPGARLLGLKTMAGASRQGMKEFGYGKPVLVEYCLDGETRQAVLSTLRGDVYGHQFPWDRAAILMFQHAASARQPRHASPLGLGYIRRDGALADCADYEEFFLLQEKIPGHDYYDDLERIRGGDFRPADLDLTRRLAAWLADIHAEKKDDPDLYYRRVRDLIGSSECIMGLIDEAYPAAFPEFPPERFLALEKRCLDWRWLLKAKAHRLAAVHGDFHPFNVLVTDEGDFGVLDRSRGEHDEPAGDLAAMAVNYLLFGLLTAPPDGPLFAGPFRQLWDAFFEEYLSRTGDEEAMEVIAPCFVFRCLVVASPRWYPSHPPAVRRALLGFMERVLESPRFDWRRVETLLSPGAA